AALGLAKLWTTDRGPTPGDVLQGHLSQAKAMLEQGEPERAIAEHLDPALAIDPANEEALNLKSRAEAVAARRTPPARDPSPTNQDPAPNPPPTAPPSLEATRELLPRTGAAREPFVAVPPENGGLERRPGETVASLRGREQAMKRLHEDAKRALQAEDFSSAERTWTSI